jgi:hypothetical protein
MIISNKQRQEINCMKSDLLAIGFPWNHVLVLYQRLKCQWVCTQQTLTKNWLNLIAGIVYLGKLVLTLGLWFVLNFSIYYKHECRPCPGIKCHLKTGHKCMRLKPGCHLRKSAHKCACIYALAEHMEW